MTTEYAKSAYQRQVTSWRDELDALGKRLENAKWDDEASYVSTRVRDLRVRVRQACAELDIYTDDGDTIDHLIRKYMDKIK